MNQAISNRRLQLNELDELHNEAYENVKIYKPNPKAFHDKKISRKYFEPNQKVWLFNSKLKLFPNKLRSRWDGYFVLQQAFPSVAIKILDCPDGCISTVNSQRFKLVVTNKLLLSLIEFINLVDPVYCDGNLSG